MMMKRLTAICLALLLLCTATALAEWEEGYSPSKPSHEVPEVDFTQTIGYMLFHPNSRMSEPALRTLRIYLPREDVKLNSAGGDVTVRSADGVETYTIAINDPECVNLRGLIPEEKTDLMWGGGLCVEITLPVSLRVGCTYYVDMDDGCIIDEENNMGSKGFNGEEHWTFTLVADYGVSALEYLRDNDGVEETVSGIAKAGDKVRFEVVLGGDAKCAVLYKLGDEEKIVFPTELMLVTESCEITGEVTGDDPAWGVMFFEDDIRENPDANMVYALSF